MLVMQSDSGYNSPCDGVRASSSFESPCLSKQFLSRSGDNSRVNRKLCFAAPFSTSESNFDIGSVLESSTIRSKEIARRLLRLCDSFDKEFVMSSEHSENSSWTSVVVRSLGF
ncbi:hypothetical protein Y032_0172g348 [Ancylostoma ceylanicum]|uniref:Uncharacterized protein n=1 Tax=Ancylostoma ceylanicum TaxID=53326 RepID=A0A016SV09_9BILA|nr:hypothetical protein Y032_0172g348 [Ancylostoma ceylanicum]